GKPAWTKRLLDNVQPIADRLLKLPRIVRIAGVGVALVLLSEFAFPNWIGTTLGFSDAVARVAFRSNSIPLSDTARRELRSILSPSDQSCESFASAKTSSDMWGYAQEYAACGAPAASFAEFSRTAMNFIDQSCKCWKYENTSRLHMYFWILEAFSLNKQ